MEDYGKILTSSDTHLHNVSGQTDPPITNIKAQIFYLNLFAAITDSISTILCFTGAIKDDKSIVLSYL